MIENSWFTDPIGPLHCALNNNKHYILYNSEFWWKIAILILDDSGFCTWEGKCVKMGQKCVKIDPFFYNFRKFCPEIFPSFFQVPGTPPGKMAILIKKTTFWPLGSIIRLSEVPTVSISLEKCQKWHFFHSKPFKNGVQKGQNDPFSTQNHQKWGPKGVKMTPQRGSI